MAQTPEPIRDIAHLGSVELFTPRPDKSLWYFHDLLGMEPVHEAGKSVYLRGYGDYATSTLKLTASEDAGVGCISWRAVSPQALDRRAKAIADAGSASGGPMAILDAAARFDFAIPTATSWRFITRSRNSSLRNVCTRRSKICRRNIPAAASACAGLTIWPCLRVMLRPIESLRRSCWASSCANKFAMMQGKTEIGSWMSPTAIHHQLAYVVDVKGAHGRLHHFSLWVDNRDDVMRAADILIENGIFIEAGPSKHNNSQGFYLYTYEPGGNRVEIYSGSFLVVAPDWEPVTWSEEERGTGVYWGATLPDSFIQYATPNVEGENGGKAPQFPVFF